MTHRGHSAGLGVALAALALLAGSGAADLGGGAEVSAAARALRGAGASGPGARRSAVDGGWHGGAVVAGTGETVNVFVSDEYAAEPNTPERWANVFAGLVHGPELVAVAVYVATPAVVAATCGDDALGCYFPGRITIPGEALAGAPPESIAAHEYGHHVAANRLNPPWVAIDWGAKRWASYARVCPLQREGRVFPGNRGWGYRLNPGEGFVDAYRALNEVRAGASAFSWTTVDNVFYPDAKALDLVARDVVDPWTGPVGTTIRARFPERGPRTFTRTIALPLDGTLSITAAMPPASGYRVTLRTGDGSRVLARARWTYGAPSRTLSHVVCGLRAARLQLVRTGGPGTVTMRVSVP